MIVSVAWLVVSQWFRRSFLGLICVMLAEEGGEGVTGNPECESNDAQKFHIISCVTLAQVRTLQDGAMAKLRNGTLPEERAKLMSYLPKYDSEVLKVPKQDASTSTTPANKSEAGAAAPATSSAISASTVSSSTQSISISPPSIGVTGAVKADVTISGSESRKAVASPRRKRWADEKRKREKDFRKSQRGAKPSGSRRLSAPEPAVSPAAAKLEAELARYLEEGGITQDFSSVPNGRSVEDGVGQGQWGSAGEEASLSSSARLTGSRTPVPAEPYRSLTKGGVDGDTRRTKKVPGGGWSKHELAKAGAGGATRRVGRIQRGKKGRAGRWSKVALAKDTRTASVSRVAGSVRRRKGDEETVLGARGHALYGTGGGRGAGSFSSSNAGMSVIGDEEPPPNSREEGQLRDISHLLSEGMEPEDFVFRQSNLQ